MKWFNSYTLFFLHKNIKNPENKHFLPKSASEEKKKLFVVIVGGKRKRMKKVPFLALSSLK